MNLADFQRMRSIRRKTDAAAVLLLTLASYGTSADDEQVQSHASIRAAAERHVLAQADRFAGDPEVNIRGLDSRLKLAACDEPLETYDSPNGLNGGRGVVGVRCNGAKPWKIYVPVHVALIDRVVVSRRPLVKGQTLRDADLTLSEADTSELRKAYFSRIEDVVGLRAKRSVASGTTLHAGLLQRAQLIKRGGQVEIVAISGGLQVRMRGKALADGSLGDRIRVENLSSGRVVSGTVVSSGVVHVLN
ncbi:MAG: flagellar basal body P-ring formation chaperone FlgA [Sedimenticolaceae bacterium]